MPNDIAHLDWSDPARLYWSDPARLSRPHDAWADLLRRTSAIDALACRGCGGRLHRLAPIEEGAVVETILRHLGLPALQPARERRGSHRSRLTAHL